MSFRIAIVDQGIDPEHDRLKKSTIHGLTIRKDPSGLSIKQNEFADDTGHGTGIASIISKMIPGVELFAVKLSSYDRRITEDLLVYALSHCLSLKDLRIINISMGIPTNEPSPELFEICRTITDKGIFIAASAYNFPNTACYPAHFPFVYGVSTGLVKDKFEYGCTDGPINILAKGTTQRVATLNNGYRISSGTSFATAHFTGIAGKILLEHSDADPGTCKKLIAENARSNVKSLYYFRNEEIPPTIHLRNKKDFDVQGKTLFSGREKLSFARRLAIYPASEKEMKTVLEFHGECIAALSSLIDYPVRLTREPVEQISRTGLQAIRDLEKIDFSAFDTLVCGYFLDQLVDANIAFGISLLEKCIILNKHFILWDVDVHNLVLKLIKEQGGRYTGHIFVARIGAEEYTKIKEYRHLPYLKTPVMSVIGTSNRQGKITAQMRIKHLLRAEGYNIAHISTEPQGILLGADFLFPYGFKCPIEPPEHEWSRLLRIAMRGIQRYHQPDLILTGTQGGILPRGRTISNEIGHDLSSMHFLLGVQPDVVACAINPMDPPKIIEQTLSVVTSYCKSKVLFCFMTPWSRIFSSDETGFKGIAHWSALDRQQLIEKMQEYEKALSLPVIDIMDPAQDAFILETIQQAFSGQTQTNIISF